MQAYISRSYVPIETWGIDIGCLPTICAFCNDEVYSEFEPIDETYIYWPTGSSSMVFMPTPKYFHIRDNTPICDARP